MENERIAFAHQYHTRTKHSPASVQADRHSMDWDNRPAPFKEYADLELLPLPRAFSASGVSAFEALTAFSPGSEPARSAESSVPSLEQLAHILYYSAGVTRKLVMPDQEIYFRAAACAGALYPIEVYLVAADLPELSAGVYHFSPLPFALGRLRAGDFMPAVAMASGGEPSVSTAPVMLVFTAITWRSSWKYQARAYRYHFWDAGTILAQSLAAAAAQNLTAKVVAGFADQEINRLLGIDGVNERAICLLSVGRDPGRTWKRQPPVPELNLAVLPISARTVAEPEIDALHAASSLGDGAVVATWRQGQPYRTVGPDPVGMLIPAVPLDGADQPPAPIEQVILRRGSTRRFMQEAISSFELSSLLASALRPFPSDWLVPESELLNQAYLSVHAVEGLPLGAYRYHPGKLAYEQLRAGNFRGDSATLCLWQRLGGESSFTLYFLSDLKSVLARYGNRGYRLAQLEAGILGGRVYLLAYALGRGATGLTFFDDLVVDFFSPTAAGLDPIFVVSGGVPAPRGRSPGRMTRVKPGQAGT